MVKKRGNLPLAISELSSDKNNAVSYVYKHSSHLNKQGALSGAVYTLKDNFATSDAPTCASSNSLKSFWPGYDSDVYKKLKQSGAICAGKTHLDELAMGGLGIFSCAGIIANPLDKTRIVGGSSSGSAATLSDAITFAICSDTGDSVRLPAAYVGKVGFKPTYGAVSRYGLFAYSNSLDTVGWMTHNVEDAVLVAKTLYGVSKNDFSSIKVDIQNVKKLAPKIIHYLDCFDLLEDYVASLYSQLIMRLKKEGIKMVKITPEKKLLNLIITVYKVITFSEARSNISAINGITFGNKKGVGDWKEVYKNTRVHGLGNQVKMRLILGSYFLSGQNYYDIFLKAQKVRRVIKEYVENHLIKGADFLLFPSSPSYAPRFGEKINADYMNNILAAANITGGPSLSLLMGYHEGLPLNINIDCLPKQDEKLLSHALWLEEFLAQKTA